MLPMDVVMNVVESYFRNFHQPYRLFSQDEPLEKVAAIPPEIIFPMLALTIRVSGHEFFAGPSVRANWTETFTSKAWDLLSDMYKAERLGLSFLQGICLLAQADFAGR